MLSIVVPCYNEGIIIEDSVSKVVHYMKTLDIDYELILVDDGSTDNTSKLLSSLEEQYDTVKCFSYKKNQGKGYAVNYGFSKSCGDIVLFMDADLATDLSAIDRCLELADTNNSFAIIGSRKLKTSVILNNNNKIRKLMSKYCTIIVNKFLGLNVSDSQCGFKVFDRDTANYLVKNQKVYGWAFDVEFILLLRKKGIKIIELPVIWNNEDRSAVSPIKSSISYIREMIKIKNLYK